METAGENETGRSSGPTPEQEAALARDIPVFEAALQARLSGAINQPGGETGAADASGAVTVGPEPSLPPIINNEAQTPTPAAAALPVADLVSSGNLEPLDPHADPVIFPENEVADFNFSIAPGPSAEEPVDNGGARAEQEANQYLMELAAQIDQIQQETGGLGGLGELLKRGQESDVGDFLRDTLPRAIAQTNRGSDDPEVVKIFGFLNNPQRIIAIKEIQKLKGISSEVENG